MPFLGWFFKPSISLRLIHLIYKVFLASLTLIPLTLLSYGTLATSSAMSLSVVLAWKWTFRSASLGRLARPSMIILRLWIGFSLRSSQTRSLKKLSEYGKFLSWLPDRSSWVILVYASDVPALLKIRSGRTKVIQTSNHTASTCTTSRVLFGCPSFK